MYFMKLKRSVKCRLMRLLTISVLVLGFCGCAAGAAPQNTENPASSESPASPAGTESPSAELSVSEKPGAGPLDAPENPFAELSIQTLMTKIGDLWFICDCYHDQVLYADSEELPVSEWKVLTADVSQPHTIAGDGTTFVVDDTENDRVLVFVLGEDGFSHTQTFESTGSRPHFCVYDEDADRFYVLSSMTGEIYVFRRKAPGSTELSPEQVLKSDRIAGTYIRSFTITEDSVWFVSGISLDGSRPSILECDRATLDVLHEYPVGDELAGMIQMTPAGGEWLFTVSTDIAGNQDAATIVRAESPEALSKGEYEDVYSRYFIGGGTPYFISENEGYYYLTEHRIPGHSIWRFRMDDGEIRDVTLLH